MWRNSELGPFYLVTSRQSLAVGSFSFGLQVNRWPSVHLEEIRKSWDFLTWMRRANLCTYIFPARNLLLFLILGFYSDNMFTLVYLMGYYTVWIWAILPTFRRHVLFSYPPRLFLNQPTYTLTHPPHTFRPWLWMQDIPLKCRQHRPRPHFVTSQKRN
jgi:hypothetical protein